MLSTQRCFLHKPVRSFSVIDAYIKEKTSESEQLDFKSIPWETGKSLEAAKDVAALANLLGGDIIIGVSDKDDCANGLNLIPLANVPTIITNIRDWLMRHLRPASFAGIVEIEAISDPSGNEAAIVVSVPPSADLIGVEERVSDKYFFEFPVRIQYPERISKRTRWLTYDEVMNRAAISTRSTYIKLRSLINSNFGEDGEPEIRFSSPVQIIVSVDPSKTPPSVNNNFRGKLYKLNETVMDIIMPSNQARDPLEHRLVIPLELIHTAWTEFSHTSRVPYLTIALNAAIQWNSQTWNIITK